MIFEFDLKHWQFYLQIGGTRHFFDAPNAFVLFAQLKEALKLQMATASDEEISEQTKGATEILFEGEKECCGILWRRRLK
jgi:hypothetical protein